MIKLTMPPTAEGSAEEQLAQLRSWLRGFAASLEKQLNMELEGGEEDS